MAETVIVPARSSEALRTAGWMQDESGFSGEFRTPAGAWPGRIGWVAPTWRVWVYKPPEWLRLKRWDERYGEVPLRARCEDPLVAKWRSDDVLLRRVQQVEGRRFSNEFPNHKESGMDETRIVEESVNRAEMLRTAGEFVRGADGFTATLDLLRSASADSIGADRDEAESRRQLAKKCMAFFERQWERHYKAAGGERFWTAWLAGRRTAEGASNAALADLQRVMDEVGHVVKNQTSVKGDQALHRMMALLAAVPTLLAAATGQQQRLIEGVRSVLRMAEPERVDRNGSS